MVGGLYCSSGGTSRKTGSMSCSPVSTSCRMLLSLVLLSALPAGLLLHPALLLALPGTLPASHAGLLALAASGRRRRWCLSWRFFLEQTSLEPTVMLGQVQPFSPCFGSSHLQHSRCRRTSDYLSSSESPWSAWQLLSWCLGCWHSAIWHFQGPFLTADGAATVAAQLLVRPVSVGLCLLGSWPHLPVCCPA